MRNKKILYFFNHLVKPLYPQIEAGTVPTDRLYGMIELRRLGWPVAECDERLTRLERFFRHYILSYINFATFKKCFGYDVLVVKDNFSLPLTLFARLTGKKIIYLDSLFYIPKHFYRRILLRINLICAPIVVSYSHYQVELWCKEFNLPKSKFVVLPYTIDAAFYTRGIANLQPSANSDTPFILATGRDTARDFGTLVRAAKNAGIKVKLVTLPYLVPASALNDPDVEVLQELSYQELFQLYTDALMVAVPLRKGVDYPSGIRAVLESMLLGKATICTVTHILEEYVPRDAQALIYVSPEDEQELTTAIQTLMSDADKRVAIAQAGSTLVAKAFGMDAFVSALDALLQADH